jgi:hypothetical protein
MKIVNIVHVTTLNFYDLQRVEFLQGHEFSPSVLILICRQLVRTLKGRGSSHGE